jgi:hypothetical protein
MRLPWHNTPDQIKYIIFDRINTGGLKLTSQEMRHALYRGRAIEFLEMLADKEIFKRATGYAISPRRMVDQEYINRFIAFYFFLENYQGNMELFLNETLEKFDRLPMERREESEMNFEKAMHYSLLIFGNNAFRKTSNPKKRQPLNKALFETISVNLSKTNISTLEAIVNEIEAFLIQYQNLLSEPLFLASISSGTGKKEKVDYRFFGVEQLLNRF